MDYAKLLLDRVQAQGANAVQSPRTFSPWCATNNLQYTCLQVRLCKDDCSEAQSSG